MKKKYNTKKLVLASLFAALTFVATLIHIHVPGMQTGYVNLGDCLVITSALLLGPIYGGLAAAIGSALTDFLHGYIIYVPATFVIKLIMAVIAYFIYTALSKDKKSFKPLPIIAGGILAELIMISGYFLYEGLFIVNFAGAALGIPGNCIQGVVAIVSAVVLLKVLKKTKITDFI